MLITPENAWLMTRDRIPDATTLQKAYGVLDRYKISRTFFVKTDQEGCAIAASDLNAALGIASTSTNVEQNAEESGSRERSGNSAVPVAEVLLNRPQGSEKPEIVEKVSASADGEELTTDQAEKDAESEKDLTPNPTGSNSVSK